MGGFGDLLGGFGELLKTFGEAAEVAEDTGMFGGGDGPRAGDPGAVYERVLAGARRELDINDR
ncbi:hypothetical protein WPS_28360 [Vulcanimicrobium alpinum]|uniref:Uncharacterized protein n=1 Tax=Vulcanimicrobium alpinum TaxID=3016050 RepID=A0AAN2CAD8_UNVUL|nr:hypothetical protein [Vulcanimicrobium alpinum]BDE07560.1 hypothetical protein WPS_28360 [Vulcanimicrobium alpinum]